MDSIQEGTVKRYIHRGRKRTVVAVDKWEQPATTAVEADEIQMPASANVINLYSHRARRRETEALAVVGQ